MTIATSSIHTTVSSSGQNGEKGAKDAKASPLHYGVRDKIDAALREISLTPNERELLTQNADTLKESQFDYVRTIARLVAALMECPDAPHLRATDIAAIVQTNPTLFQTMTGKSDENVRNFAQRTTNAPGDERDLANYLLILECYFKVFPEQKKRRMFAELLEEIPISVERMKTLSKNTFKSYLDTPDKYVRLQLWERQTAMFFSIRDEHMAHAKTILLGANERRRSFAVYRLTSDKRFYSRGKLKIFPARPGYIFPRFRSIAHGDSGEVVQSVGIVVPKSRNLYFLGTRLDDTGLKIYAIPTKDIDQRVKSFTGLLLNRDNVNTGPLLATRIFLREWSDEFDSKIGLILRSNLPDEIKEMIENSIEIGVRKKVFDEERDMLLTREGISQAIKGHIRSNRKKWPLRDEDGKPLNPVAEDLWEVVGPLLSFQKWEVDDTPAAMLAVESGGNSEESKRGLDQRRSPDDGPLASDGSANKSRNAS